jgi:hypothetical protein
MGSSLTFQLLDILSKPSGCSTHGQWWDIPDSKGEQKNQRLFHMDRDSDFFRGIDAPWAIGLIGDPCGSRSPISRTIHISYYYVVVICKLDLSISGIDDILQNLKVRRLILWVFCSDFRELRWHIKWITITWCHHSGSGCARSVSNGCPPLFKRFRAPISQQHNLGRWEPAFQGPITLLGRRRPFWTNEWASLKVFTLIRFDKRRIDRSRYHGSLESDEWCSVRKGQSERNLHLAGQTGDHMASSMRWRDYRSGLWMTVLGLVPLWKNGRIAWANVRKLKWQLIW